MGDFFAGLAEVGATSGKVGGLIRKIGGMEEGKGVGWGCAWVGRLAFPFTFSDSGGREMRYR